MNIENANPIEYWQPFPILNLSFKDLILKQFYYISPAVFFYFILWKTCFSDLPFLIQVVFGQIFTTNIKNKKGLI